MRIHFALFALLAVLFACGDDGSSSPADGGSDTDAGATVMDAGIRACSAALPTLPAAQLPRCSAETGACIAACMDQDCFDACVAADDTPPGSFLDTEVDCETCIDVNPLACSSNMSCASTWSTWNCCLDECDMAGNSAEVCDTMCEAEASAFFECFEANLAECRAAYAACFAAPVAMDAGVPTDAGVPDAGVPDAGAMDAAGVPDAG